MPDYEERRFASAADWRAWLEEHHDSVDGLRIILAKKGAPQPSVTYAEAIQEALCFGWIDGRRNGRDEESYLQTFTPRRARSMWSQVNIAHVERLIEAGRMHVAGQREIDRAKADGRWDAAYAPPSRIEVPEDLTAALAADPAAGAAFAGLDSQNRFAILFRIHQAKRPETRARRIQQFVAMLAAGDTIYPRKS